MEFDYIVVGSGFGGSVAALRLSEKGYRVAILEQGCRVTSEAMKKADTQMKALFWEPKLGVKGYFSQDFFSHAGVVRGIGVGGGSLVYAGVLLQPKEAFYHAQEWSDLADWKAELQPFYQQASLMLGIATNPRHGEMDEQLLRTAQQMGKTETFGRVPQGIFFPAQGEGGERCDDPYFDGRGPQRVNCNFCGKCVTGCALGAKNSLDKNYLYFAEKNGVQVFAEHEVIRIDQLAKGYMLRARYKTGLSSERKWFRANGIVLAGGVLGTLELLYRCRDEHKSLPDISSALGQKVRTNSEALVASLSKDRSIDLTKGTTISSDFYPDDKTHVTQNRIPPGYGIMRFYFGPMIDEARPLYRALKTLKETVLHPGRSTRSWFMKDWHKRATLLTVMQYVDNQLQLKLRRRWFSPWKKSLDTVVGGAAEASPAYIAIANQTAKSYAKANNGEAQSIVMESVGNKALTAHILGGCPIGATAQEGVIDKDHRVFGYPNMFITDASAIPANIGVNPSLTITAMAERAMAKIPAKPQSKIV